MRNLKQIASLVKKEFNNPRFVEKYCGLCIALLVLSNNNIITEEEKNTFSDVINDELDKRTKCYIMDLKCNYHKQTLTNNNSKRAYIWEPFVTTGRNRFLNKIINN